MSENGGMEEGKRDKGEKRRKKEKTTRNNKGLQKVGGGNKGTRDYKKSEGMMPRPYCGLAT